MSINRSVKWNRKIDEHVRLPQSTVGLCKNYGKCRSFDIELGNGYCVSCWDKGFDTQKTKLEAK